MKTKIKIFSLLLITTISLTQVHAQNKIEWTGTDEQKLMGLFTIWSEAKFAFPFFYQIPEVNWDLKVQEYIPKVLASKDIESYYNVLMEFSALLNDGHTGVNPPWGLFKPGFDYPPMEVEMIENKFIITKVGETSEMKFQNVYPGLEILEVDNINTEKYFEENVLRFNKRGTKQADEAINLWTLFQGEKDSKVHLKVKDIDGTIRVLEITRNSSLNDENKFYCQMLRWYMLDPILESKLLPNEILYVKISNFDKEELITEFKNLIQDNNEPEVKGMIIDLRHNPGGESSIAEKIISSLIDQPISSAVWHIPHYVAADRAWGNNAVWSESKNNIEPTDGKKYLGPLVILTGSGTFSSAEDFIVPIHYSKRAVLVGEKTAGSSGNPLRVQLPGGGNFRVVTVKMTYPDDKEYIGIGIQPDVEIYPTQMDILKGNDPILNKGIEVLKNWGSSINH
jgi:carboxyl-terminal processing protease